MPLSVLMLADIRDAAQHRVAILDHMRFLDHAPVERVRVTYVNVAEQPSFDPRWLEHDVIILHTTLLCWRWQLWFKQIAPSIAWLADYRGLVVAMPQDEYDHAHILDRWLLELNTQIVVTCFDESTRPLLYPRLHNRAYFQQGLTGFLNPQRVAQIPRPPVASRPLDVVYRANHSPPWTGWLGHIKASLGTEGPRLLAPTGLRTDISVRREDTILGDAWLDFLASGRTVLGSESGSSVLDRHGEVQLHARALLQDQPTLTFEELDALMAGELTRFHFGALGPRHLEATLTGTVQVLVEGDYQGVLRPWEHYIPVSRDLSSLGTLHEVMADGAFLQRVADQAYEEIAASGQYTYDRFATTMLDLFELFLSTRRAAQPGAATAA